MKALVIIFSVLAIVTFSRTKNAVANDLTKKKVVVIAFEDSDDQDSSDSQDDLVSEEEQSAQARHDARMRSSIDTPVFEDLLKEL